MQIESSDSNLIHDPSAFKLQLQAAHAWGKQLVHQGRASKLTDESRMRKKISNHKPRSGPFERVSSANPVSHPESSEERIHVVLSPFARNAVQRLCTGYEGKAEARVERSSAEGRANVSFGVLASVGEKWDEC